MDGELCWVLSLDINEDQILGSMRKTTRYEIRRAEKLGVWVKVANDSHDIGKFLALYEKTSKRQGFTAHTGIREEFEVFVKEGNAKLYLGYFQKTLVAGALILYYGGQAIYHHGASIHSLAPVSTLIQWQAIKDAKKAGLKVYNFWGIAPSGKNRHPWQGLTLFKKGFGGKELNYHHAMDLPLHPLYAFTYVSELLRKWKKGY
jgi:lipid II:glycine glycyltransferase (peptidoglycan interpeptide bridge formation enzyme)